MLDKLKLLFVLSFVFIITSCSMIYGDRGIIHNRDTDYLKAENIPPLKIPPGLSSSTIQAHYPVPYKNYPESAKKVSLIPPEL